jgi:hypothetical protein
MELLTFRCRLLLLTAACGAGVAACGDQRQTLSAETVAGCYALVRRDGGTYPLGLQMPDTLQLSATMRPGPDGEPHPKFPLALEVIAQGPRAGRDSLRLDASHVVPWPPPWPGYYSMTGWRFAALDSVAIILHANMNNSWELQLRVAGDSLFGSAAEYSDVVEGHPTIPIAGHRIVCSATAAQRAAI